MNIVSNFQSIFLFLNIIFIEVLTEFAQELCDGKISLITMYHA